MLRQRLEQPDRAAGQVLLAASHRRTRRRRPRTATHECRFRMRILPLRSIGKAFLWAGLGFFLLSPPPQLMPFKSADVSWPGAGVRFGA